MKVKTSTVVLTIISAVIVILGVTYFGYLLPIMNFANNERASTPIPDVETVSGDLIKVSTPEPENPYATPGESSRDNIQYAPTLPESNTNILVLGTDQSAGLTDSIYVVSIDKTGKEIQIISIPRDSYVPYDDSVVQILKNKGIYKSPGMFKINAAPNIGTYYVHYTGGKFQNTGVNFLCSILQSMLGYRIDDYVEVDFQGFKDLVDSFGGVTVNVAEDMYTPNGELTLSKGTHKLNGEMALYYARARHKYTSTGKEVGTAGDPYRKDHQLNMITDMAKDIITVDNIARVKDIMAVLQNAVYHSFDMNDFGDYAQMGIDYAHGEYKVKTVLIEGQWFDPLGDHISYCKIYK